MEQVTLDVCYSSSLWLNQECYCYPLIPQSSNAGVLMAYRVNLPTTHPGSKHKSSFCNGSGERIEVILSPFFFSSLAVSMEGVGSAVHWNLPKWGHTDTGAERGQVVKEHRPQFCSSDHTRKSRPPPCWLSYWSVVAGGLALGKSWPLTVSQLSLPP